MPEPLLEIRNLNVAFETNRGDVRPVRDSSLSIYPGQTVAVVGESGCGKSVTAMSVLRLIPSPPGKVLGGQIIFNGRDLLSLSESEMRRVRGKDIAMIFQEPMTSLNPVYTIGDQIVEAITLHQHVNSRQAYEIAEQALKDVGIADPNKRLRAYPHEMSGGMRQRVMIAMALSCKPKLLIADEPTTALDVTIQAQILELLRKLQREQGMAIMLITHDLGVVAENADVVAVMYASRVVEVATVEELFDHPKHPYTEALFRSVPKLGARAQRLDTIPGTVPNPAKFPTGCKFHTRCHRTRELAAKQQAVNPSPGGAVHVDVNYRGGGDPILSAPQVVNITNAGERFNVLGVCTTVEPDAREIESCHWAACHQLPGYDNAKVTIPELAHQRTVTPNVVESGTAAATAAVVSDAEVTS